MNNKYELVTYPNKCLKRIKALKDFANIKKGEEGGWVEGEKNLGISGDARV
jgi:hypothetical protein